MADKTNKEARIRATLEAWAEALRAKDAKRVVSHYADGFVHFSLAPPLRSKETGTKGLEEWFATWRGGLGYEISDLAIVADADVAFTHSLDRLSGTKAEDGQREEVWFRHTVGLRNIGGAWKIVHEHESVPFYMDGSYKAAVDLKP
jgi:PhnB protein